jgi:hypothetical protein
MRLSTCSVGHLALLMWSMAELQWTPPRAWIDGVVADVAERAGELDLRALQTVLYGCVEPLEGIV